MFKFLGLKIKIRHETVTTTFDMLLMLLMLMLMINELRLPKSEQFTKPVCVKNGPDLAANYVNKVQFLAPDSEQPQIIWRHFLLIK